MSIYSENGIFFGYLINKIILEDGTKIVRLNARNLYFDVEVPDDYPHPLPRYAGTQIFYRIIEGHRVMMTDVDVQDVFDSYENKNNLSDG